MPMTMIDAGRRQSYAFFCVIDALMSCLFLIARVFALPLAILLCDRLQLLRLNGNYWDVLWIAL